MYSHFYKFEQDDNYTMWENRGSVNNVNVDNMINNLFDSESPGSSVKSINVVETNNEEIKSHHSEHLLKTDNIIEYELMEETLKSPMSEKIIGLNDEEDMESIPSKKL